MAEVIKMNNAKFAAAVALSALVLTGCGGKKASSVPEISVPVSSSSAVTAASEVFSVSDALNFGTKYLGTLSYENAIVQYMAILEHDPTNKEAYAGLYAAYVGAGETEKAQEVLEQASEALGSEDEILPYIIEDGRLVYNGGGGSGVMGAAADWYADLDEENSARVSNLEAISEAWRDMEPGNPEAYEALALAYAQQSNASQLEWLQEIARSNGVDVDELNSAVSSRSNGEYTIYIGSSSVAVEITPETTPSDIQNQILGNEVENAASSIAKESFPDNPAAASAADSMIQEALRQGLSALN